MNTDPKKIASKLIEELGGLYAVAKICHIKPQSVNGWRKRRIPPARLQYLKLAYPNLKAWALETVENV